MFLSMKPLVWGSAVTMLCVLNAAVQDMLKTFQKRRVDLCLCVVVSQDSIG